MITPAANIEWDQKCQAWPRLQRISSL